VNAGKRALAVDRAERDARTRVKFMHDSAAKGGRPGARPINWRNALFFLALHAIAALAFLPWFFSWTGVLTCVVGVQLIGMLGINVGYHRLFTHRGFTCPRWVERTLAILGCCCGQDSPTYWVAIHRRHHHHSDDASDPHSPLLGFFWGHVGWLLVISDDLDRHPLMDRYAKDLRRDPFHEWLVRHDNWIFIMLGSWGLFFAAGFLAAIATGASAAAAGQFGWSLMIWGGPVRTVVVWHLTWIVNSADHLWGYRNYDTPDNSRNSIWTGIICNGDGWHNNHHADPRSARHGHKWWELDLAWLAIRLMMALGLASNAALPSPILATKFNGIGRRPALPDYDPAEAEGPPRG
jgi:fatty-acid desaturase